MHVKTGRHSIVNLEEKYLLMAHGVSSSAEIVFTSSISNNHHQQSFEGKYDRTDSR
ncbi:MAG: hypothetical protein IT451_02195 [Candidatus Brocadia sp.]|nr:hypothetical protein [Candidatus Brocadia sp.]